MPHPEDTRVLTLSLISSTEGWEEELAEFRSSREIGEIVHVIVEPNLLYVVQHQGGLMAGYTHDELEVL